MTAASSAQPRTLGLWLAAAGCAVTGVVLLTPGLPGSTSATPPAAPATAAPPPAAPAPAAPAPAPATSSTPSAEPPTGTGTPPSASTGRRGPAASDQPDTRGQVPAPSQEQPHQDEAPAAAPTSPLPADQVAGHTDAHAPPADEQQWRPVLTGFATDFTRFGTGTKDWARRLSRWTTPQLAEAYAGVDSRRVPTGALVDVDVADVGAYALSFTARYDSGLVVQGQAALGPDRWQVTSAQPATARSPG